MARIAIIVGHARKDTFSEAIGRGYQTGAIAGGHHVKMFVLSRMAFDPILREGFEREQPLEPDLKAAHDAMIEADHLVIVFPLWLGGMPAILKGFLERVIQPDLVPLAKSGIFAQPLKGKSVRIIVTMGMPAFVYRWWFGAYAVKQLRRNILEFIGAGPVHTTINGYVDGVGQSGRAQWLKEAEEMGRLAV